MSGSKANNKPMTIEEADAALAAAERLVEPHREAMTAWRERVSAAARALRIHDETPGLFPGLPRDPRAASRRADLVADLERVESDGPRLAAASDEAHGILNRARQERRELSDRLLQQALAARAELRRERAAALATVAAIDARIADVERSAAPLLAPHLQGFPAQGLDQLERPDRDVPGPDAPIVETPRSFCTSLTHDEPDLLAHGANVLGPGVVSALQLSRGGIPRWQILEIANFPKRSIGIGDEHVPPVAVDGFLLAEIRAGLTRVAAMCAQRNQPFDSKAQEAIRAQRAGWRTAEDRASAVATSAVKVGGPATSPMDR